MRWELATDEQLKIIVGHDNDCPHSLLSGVVTEMLNRGLLEGLVKKVIMSHFSRIEISSHVLKMPEEDIFQFCRMKIFESLKRFKPGMKPFMYFAFIFVKAELKDLETKVKAEKRKVYENIQSIDVELDSGDDFASLLPSETNVEKEVIRKISLEEKMSILTEIESKCFLLYLEGYSTEEIRKKLNITKGYVVRKVNAAISKMCGKQTTLKELGCANYAKGA